MNIRTVRHKGCVKLVYDDPHNEYGAEVAVAAIELFEGTGCWTVADWRLSAHKVLSPWSASIDADDACARYSPKTPEESAFVKALLRECDEHKNGQLVWCTFENFYRGHRAVKGHRPEFRTCHQSGYFGYREALAKLGELRAFWDAFEGDPSTARIENPDRQLSASQVSSEVVLARMLGKLPERFIAHAEGFQTPSPPPSSER